MTEDKREQMELLIRQLERKMEAHLTFLRGEVEFNEKALAALRGGRWDELSARFGKWEAVDE